MMQRIRLKICGLRDNIQEVAALQPDYAGFIFYQKSPRYIGKDFRIPELDLSTKKVGVFVNESIDAILDLAGKNHLDFVQLHGVEKPEECGMLKEKGVGIIKAFAIDEHFDFRQMEQYDSTVDYFLFDTRTPEHGGSGRSFNWELLNQYKMGKKYFLSGGINLENVEDIKNLDLEKIHAIDVNSRFEVSPGLKDIQALVKLKAKIKELN